MYEIVSHIFVHTDKMKRELHDDFNIGERKVTVIPFGVNNTVPQSNLSPRQAKNKLGLNEQQRVLLFFGQIAPYKGLDQALLALTYLNKGNHLYKLIIAGKIKSGCDAYWSAIRKIISDKGLDRHIISVVHFIPDCDVEVYFKAADVSVLPYRHIFQTGVLFLACSFGLPVIATDVGFLKDDIIDGVTGFVCKYVGPESLAKKIADYFDSHLFHNLEANRLNIIKYANDNHSWDVIGKATVDVYKSIP
jgi:D-inositol-3-phosphate glycosyltransferase